jgi:hypothetical protein
MPKPLMVFVRSGLPMGERLISTLTDEQCESIGELVERWAEQLKHERARYRHDHGERLGA